MAARGDYNNFVMQLSSGIFLNQVSFIWCQWNNKYLLCATWRYHVKYMKLRYGKLEFLPQAFTWSNKNTILSLNVRQNWEYMSFFSLFQISPHFSHKQTVLDWLWQMLNSNFWKPVSRKTSVHSHEGRRRCQTSVQHTVEV